MFNRFQRSAPQSFLRRNAQKRRRGEGARLTETEQLKAGYFLKGFYLACALAVMPMACSHEGASASPISGMWKSAAPVHRVTSQDVSPQYISIMFGADGKATMRYVPGIPTQGGLLDSKYIDEFTHPKTDIVPYDDLGGGRVRFTVDNAATTYTYEVKDGKLYLTPPGFGFGSGDLPSYVFIR
jgi:hypothetical protein